MTSADEDSPCGDSMLLVELEPVIDPVINERAILLAARLRARGRPRRSRRRAWVFARVGVHFDPLQTDLAALEQAIETEFAGARGRSSAIADRDGDRDPGAATAATSVPISTRSRRFAGCSAAEVIARHSSRTYRVYMLGFVPGFAYMGRVDPSIAAPRHRVPRERVPAGSVGIAGLQTGVYPVESPGGWQLIGHTDDGDVRCRIAIGQACSRPATSCGSCRQ